MPHVNGKKPKKKHLKKITIISSEPDTPLQYNIPKGVEEDKKVNPKDVFVGVGNSDKLKHKNGKGK